ncbi:breast cancer anti-estrogen resistance protein 3 homolog isoform X2 [Rhodnius prolixus]|uniref:breast cancer anti-estrogen resistance protein 3 homolog isoform X2 n=1 Tax=Rhodnius prolixus TaxID=13249 RepID=UPI003D18DFC9
MGKSGSKLKRKDRSQSIFWSFRFGSLGPRRKMAPPGPTATPTPPPHMEISKWLNVLELTQYMNIFDTYKGVEDLLEFSEGNIKDLGVKNAAHRARIVSSLVALKSKYQKGQRKADKQSLRHSVAVDPSNIVHESTESDLLVVSNVTQSKSLCNIKMEAVVDPVEGGAGLKRALEWELSLDSRDLRSHAWYHGAIPRVRAEEIVRQQGEFLVRDCTSQPGNFVLTCRSGGVPLHFVINKVVIQPDTVYETVQYQFEDEPFDTVPDLITYYVGSGKSITTASRARIQYPCNRMFPLSFYATKYGLHSQATSPLPRSSPAPSPTRTRWDNMPPRVPSKKTRSHSLAPENGRAVLTLARVDDRSNSADGVIQDQMSRSVGCETVVTKFSTHSLPRGNCLKKTTTLPRKMTRVTSDPTLSPNAERRPFPDQQQSQQPPPKPVTRPSLMKLDDIDITDSPHYTMTGQGSFNRVISYHASGSDSGNGSGDSVQSSAAGDISDSAVHCTMTTLRPGGVIVKNPHYTSSSLTSSFSSTTLKACDYDSGLEDSIPPTTVIDLPSSFNLDSFQTILLPCTENKPLDATALKGIRTMLQDNGSRIIANHLTRADLELIIDKNTALSQQVIGVTSGLELCALTFGHQMRLDLIERTICLKLLVAVTILTCNADSERAETLNKWIQVAIDTKTALGNLFGFNAIMMGLCMPQILRLSVTWHILRQNFTDSAFNFEAKLRPTLKNMNECTNPQAPNTTIPHILPFILLLERSQEDTRNNTCNSSIEFSCIQAWESSASDQGLKTLSMHMEDSRRVAQSLATYRRNSEIVLGDSRIVDLLGDVFRTEFQLKFLWGSRGAGVAPAERHAKFEQILNAMSEMCEPPPPRPQSPPPPAPLTPGQYNPAIGTSV